MTTQEESLEKRIAAAAEKEARATKRAEELRAEAAKLRAKRELLEAKKLQLLVKADRADETRKKILAGAAFLKAVENGQINKLACRSILERFLTREQDRALFKELWEVPATATPRPAVREAALMPDPDREQSRQILHEETRTVPTPPRSLSQ